MLKQVIKLTLIISCLVPHFLSVAQRHDNHWVLGYDSSNNPSDTVTGTVIVNFDEDAVRINYPLYDSISFDMWRNCVSMSDENGKLIFYTNGIQLNNAAHKMMQGSEDYNYHPFHEQYEDVGLFTPQGSIALPAPGKDEVYYLIHPKVNRETIGLETKWYSSDLFFSAIDMNLENGLGKMIEVATPIVNDTLELFGITAVKHANGRDYWVVSLDDDQVNQFYLTLVDPTGPHLHHIQDLTAPFDQPSGPGQPHFSPDGRWYIKNTITFLGGASFLDVFEFDRCSGKMNKFEYFTYSDSNRNSGCAISKNSRFIYTADGNNLFQFDLDADEIYLSRILIDQYDGYRTPNNFPSTFGQMWLAPDGKIYMTCANGMKPTHVIHHPDRKGKACQFEQRAFNFPKANASSIPNHPNYRLGPIDGSAADTLGIDNLPLARWRHDDHYRHVEFTDLSDYEPETWYWTFGDGGFSSDTSPVHTYAAEGFYKVCLIVSNVNDSDTLCRTIQVRDSLTATSAVEKQTGFILYPNPTSDFIYLKSSDNLGQVDIRLFDLHGRLVLSDRMEIMYNHFAEIDIRSLIPGVYFLEFWKEGLKLGGEKVIVSR